MAKKQQTVKNQLVSGIVKRHPDGFGFLIPDDPSFPDIYVSKTTMEGVMTNDRIEIQIKEERGTGRFRGDVKRVLDRNTKFVTGRLHIDSPSHGLLIDDSFGWGENIRISIPPGMKVEKNDWVKARITSYADSFRGLCGEVQAVLGDPGDPANDNRRILAVHDIPTEFSKACLLLAEKIPQEVSDNEIEKHRIDITHLPLITIDGQTAKDFDDAIYVEPTKSGFRLIVAIADVSYYVKPGDAIDEDAVIRGTSTYLPNFVAPMLPEALSNEICSLKPNVRRMALVAEMQFNFDGDKTATKFYEAVIKSHSRVTYGEAQLIIDGEANEKHSHVRQQILDASNLAKILMNRRFHLGSLDLDIPETIVEVNEDGVPTDILKSARLFAHRLIEELMLSANVAVAEFIQSKGRPCMYRIHESPKEENIAKLQNYMELYGYDKRLSGGGLQKKLTKALQFFSGKPQESIMNILALRSMSQAKYAEENIGHFGLGFNNYSHFTSPIRRYPDLIIHRIVKSIILDQKEGYRPYPEEVLASQGVMLSAYEQRSVKAERQVQSIKKARFIENFVGSEFEGFISSVAKFGVFVVLRQYDVDGLIRLEDLKGDYFEFDDERLVLVGKKTGITYSVGDPMKIVVAGVDTDAGKIDFVPVLDKNVTSGDGGSGKKVHKTKGWQKSKPSKKRGKTSKDSGGVRKKRPAKSRRKSKTR